MKSERSLKDAIYNAVMEDIFAMEYLPGDILNEKNLIEKYNCSKSPVREALQALCMDGVLRSIPRYGYEVVRLTVEDLQEMLQYRMILEGGMLRTRIDRLTEGQIKRLEAIDEKCSLHTDDPWTHWAYNAEFHLKLISFCGNQYAAEELRRCLNRLKRGYAQLCINKWDQEPVVDTRHHKPLLAALRSHDEAAALKALQDDLNDFAFPNALGEFV